MISPPSGATQNTAPGAVSDDGIEHDQPPCLVALDAFSGPLDLLLFLVRRAEVDVIDIPISDIADQFVATVAAWADLDLDLAGDFILMAATLLEIKARMIAPPSEEPVEEGADEEVLDLRSGLVAKLLAYRRCKEAALILAEREDERNHACTRQFREDIPDDPEELGIDLENADPYALAATWESVLARIQGLGPRTVMADPLPLDTAMAMLVQTVQALGSERLSSLLATQSSRLGRVTLVMAVLECVRQHLMTVAQHGQYEEIELRFRPVEDRSAAATLPPEVPDSGKRKRRPPLITIAGKAASDDTEPLADEVVESDEQRFMRELEEACALESVLARCSDLDSNFARFWALKRGLPWPPPELTVTPSEPAPTVALAGDPVIPATTTTSDSRGSLPQSEAPTASEAVPPPVLDVVLAGNPSAEAVITTADPVPPLTRAAPDADASVAASTPKPVLDEIPVVSTEPGERADHRLEENVPPLPSAHMAPEAMAVEPGEISPSPAATPAPAPSDVAATDSPSAVTEHGDSDSVGVSVPICSSISSSISPEPAGDTPAVASREPAPLPDSEAGVSPATARSQCLSAPVEDAALTTTAPAPMSLGATVADAPVALPSASPPDDQMHLPAAALVLPEAADAAPADQGLTAPPPAADPPVAALPDQDPSAAPWDRAATALADAVASPPQPPTPEADLDPLPAPDEAIALESPDDAADTMAQAPLSPAPAPSLVADVIVETPRTALAAAPPDAAPAASGIDAAPSLLAPAPAPADDALAVTILAQEQPAVGDRTPRPALASTVAPPADPHLNPPVAPPADPPADNAPDVLATAVLVVGASDTPGAASAAVPLPVAAADIWPEVELTHDGDTAETTITPGSQAYRAARAIQATAPSAEIAPSTGSAGDEALSPTQQRTRATTLHAFPPAPVARRYHRQLALTATVALLIGTWYLSHHLASSHVPATSIATETGPAAPGPLRGASAAQSLAPVASPLAPSTALGAAVQELVALPAQWPAMLANMNRLERWAAAITPTPVIAPSPVFSSYATRLSVASRSADLAGFVRLLAEPLPSAPLVILPARLSGGAPVAPGVHGASSGSASATAHDTTHAPASSAAAREALGRWMRENPTAAIAVARCLASILSGSAPVIVPRLPPPLPGADDQAGHSLRAMPYQRQDLMSSASWLVLGAWRGDEDAP